MKTHTMPDLPCPVCGQTCRADKVLRHQEKEGNWLEVELIRLIDLLRSQEGDSVTILCDNPDFNMGANNAVECNGDWTGWKDQRFEGESLLDALSAAMIEYRRPRSPQENASE